MKPRLSQRFKLASICGLLLLAIIAVALASGPARPAQAATNLALNRPVSASSTYSTSFPASAAVDGSTTTRWSSAFGDPQWIRVDLGQSYSISSVRLSWEAAYGRAYQIQLSNDGTNWTTVSSTTSGDGGVDSLTVSGTGRYVRMYGTARATAYGYSLFEFEVYGSSTAPTSTPVPPTATTTTAVNLALNRPASASSTYSSSFPASAADDPRCSSDRGSNSALSTCC